MTTKEIRLVNTRQPEYSHEYETGKRLALWLDYGGFELEDIIGDYVGFATLLIASGYHDIDSKDDIAKSLWRAWQETDGSQQEKKETAAKLLDELGKDYKFVSLTGYSQGEWAEIVVYGKNVNLELDGVIEDIKAWFRGEVYTLTTETLKTYTATDGEQVAEWVVDDAIGICLLTGRYNLNGQPNWQEMASDNFGIEVKNV